MNKATRAYYKPDVPLADDPAPRVEDHIQTLTDPTTGRRYYKFDASKAYAELLCHCGEPANAHGLGCLEHSFRPMEDDAEDAFLGAMFAARAFVQAHKVEREARSFKQWRELGRSVGRGEKSKERGPDGVPLFTYDQTRPMTVLGHREEQYKDVARRGAAKLIKRFEKTYVKPDPPASYSRRGCECGPMGPCICGEYDLPPGVM